MSAINSHSLSTAPTVISLVLSRLDYGSQLWSPTKIHQIIMIEKIQKAFTKHIKGFSHSPTRKDLVILKFTPSNIEERDIL